MVHHTVRRLQADGPLEDLNHTFAGLDSQSDMVEQLTLPASKLTATTISSVSSSEMSSDTALEQADLLGLHDMGQQIEESQHLQSSSEV